MKKKLYGIVNFLFEVGMLSNTPRSGFHLLGSGTQTVAEHLNRTTYIGYVLSTMDTSVDQAKVLKMCLFHDLAEARTSDLNYLHQKYTQSNEEKVLQDLVRQVEFGSDIYETLKEMQEAVTKEALIAHDADKLEFLLCLKEQVDIGNTRAETWIPSSIKRLKTDSAKQIAQEIIITNSDDWWFANKQDKWWIKPTKRARKGRI